MFDVIIEVSKGSNLKYEISKETNLLRLDRVLHTSMFYPGNYGYFPQTLAGDGDPLDVLVLTDYVLQPGIVVECKIIGVLLTEDEKGLDEKILAVPSDKVDKSTPILFSNYKIEGDISSSSFRTEHLERQLYYLLDKYNEEKDASFIKYMSITNGTKTSCKINIITIDNKKFFSGQNKTVFIPKGSIHRIENPFRTPVKIIEVQMGSKLIESDILRYSDIYGRVKQ